MKRAFKYLLLSASGFLMASLAFAQNPIIRDQFTADPSARVFGDRVYVFPSHDIRCDEGQGRGPDWFCMADYHVFSSENLTDWTDHGMIVSQEDVPWADAEAYSMWAPDCIEKDGKYYFYFPTIKGDTAKYGRGFGIGVAIADKPEGPYKVHEAPIAKINGIDPNVIIDIDGQAYLYWSMRHLFVAKLKPNMVELDSEPMIIANMPEKGMKEGPYMFERNGWYYLTYPHVANKTERLEYAMGKSPMGPFEVKGVIMEESPTGCWTNHHSVIEYKSQWYLFYHSNDLSPDFDKNRSVRIDSLKFNDDGTIVEIMPTHRGVGVTKATDKIQIDRYSAISEKGASVEFVDTTNRFDGWKTVLNEDGAWIQYNTVDFGSKKIKSIEVNAKSASGSSLQVRINSLDGPVIAEVKIPAGDQWSTVSVPVKSAQKGVQNLVVTSKGNNEVEVEWLSFK